MKDEEENLYLMTKKRLRHIQKEIIEILKIAPAEEDCNNIENDLFGDLSNVVNDIDNYFEMFD